LAVVDTLRLGMEGCYKVQAYQATGWVANLVLTARNSVPFDIHRVTRPTLRTGSREAEAKPTGAVQDSFTRQPPLMRTVACDECLDENGHFVGLSETRTQEAR
jgi:hypothetical protein